jgi:hypothetical protein
VGDQAVSRPVSGRTDGIRDSYETAAAVGALEFVSAASRCKRLATTRRLEHFIERATHLLLVGCPR